MGVTQIELGRAEMIFKGVEIFVDFGSSPPNMRPVAGRGEPQSTKMSTPLKIISALPSSIWVTPMSWGKLQRASGPTRCKDQAVPEIVPAANSVPHRLPFAWRHLPVISILTKSAVESQRLNNPYAKGTGDR